MRLVAAAISFGVLGGCWYDRPRPARPAAPDPAEEAEASSYRSVTIAVDAIGVTAMAIGVLGLHRGYDEDLSGALAVAGLATAAYATPILHLAHGHRARAGGSFLVRSIASSTGSVVGLMAGCPEDRGQWFCGMTGMMWGVAGGLAVAGAIDAVYFHDDQSPRGWAPTLTTSDGGARVGIGGAF